MRPATVCGWAVAVAAIPARINVPANARRVITCPPAPTITPFDTPVQRTRRGARHANFLRNYDSEIRRIGVLTPTFKPSLCYLGAQPCR